MKEKIVKFYEDENGMYVDLFEGYWIDDYDGNIFEIEMNYYLKFDFVFEKCVSSDGIVWKDFDVEKYGDMFMKKEIVVKRNELGVEYELLVSEFDRNGCWFYLRKKE